MQGSDRVRKIELHASLANAATARTFVADYLTEHDLSHLVESACQVVSELATNAIVHARTSFTITMSQADGTVLLRVGDQSSMLPVRFEPEEMDISGRGLMIVEALSLDWGVISGPLGSKTIWASFARTGGGT